jgi:hypothetical protein
VDARLGSRSSTGTITLGGDPVKFTIIGSAGYINTGQAGLKRLGMSQSVQRRDAGRWLKYPVSEFTGLTLASIASQLTRSYGPLEPKVRQAALDGQKVVVVGYRNGSKVYAANTGPAYPLRADYTGQNSARIAFSEYGVPLHITVPSGAIDLSNAAGSQHLPGQLFGLNMSTGRTTQEFIRTVTTGLDGQRSLFRSAQGAAYGPGGLGPSSSPGIVLFEAMLATAAAQGANPALDKRLAGYFVRITGITKMRSFPAGPLGGALYCGHGIQSGVPGIVCGWADKVRAGEVVYFNGVASSLSDAAAKSSQVRALIEP